MNAPPVAGAARAMPSEQANEIRRVGTLLRPISDRPNFNKSYFQGSSENLHVVERFTRGAEDTIEYEISASDPGTWTQPWTAVVHLKQTQNRVYEYACHEGNHHIMVGMLAGANTTQGETIEPTARPR